MLLSTLIFGALASAVTASPIVSRSSNSTCGVKEQRKSWHNLSNEEKTAYIDADLCLMNLPSKTDFPGASTRWDDLQYAHINLTNIIHGVGGFLPWHRFYVYTHLELMKNECNYTGGQHYWEELLDTLPNAMEDSPVFDTVYGFGGNGVGDNKCVVDGPFANTTMHYGPTYEMGNDLCLARNFSSADFQWANQTYLDAFFAAEDYETAWLLLIDEPHKAGHLGVGGSTGNGTILDQACSPGDPLFFLHHTNLDRLWWEWQSANSSRLTEMSGPNRPPTTWIDEFDLGFVGDSWFNYDGDNGTAITTLNHTLTVLGLVANATVSDVMDIGAGLLCYEYV